MVKDKQTPSAKFYLVDDVPVCVWNNGEETFGFVLTTGYPYPILKAMSEGRAIILPEFKS